MKKKIRRPKTTPEYQLADARLQSAVVRGESKETIDKLRAERDALASSTRKEDGD